jgi:hypothetical protein
MDILVKACFRSGFKLAQTVLPCTCYFLSNLPVSSISFHLLPPAVFRIHFTSICNPLSVNIPFILFYHSHCIIYVTILHLYTFLFLSEDLAHYRPVSPLLHFSDGFNITIFKSLRPYFLLPIALTFIPHDLVFITYSKSSFFLSSSFHFAMSSVLSLMYIFSLL